MTEFRALHEYDAELLARVPDTHEVFVFDLTTRVPTSVAGWLFITHHRIETATSTWLDAAVWDRVQCTYGSAHILAFPKSRPPAGYVRLVDAYDWQRLEEATDEWGLPDDS